MSQLDVRQVDAALSRATLMTMTRAIFLAFALILSATFGMAEPVPYALDVKASKVGFFYTMGGRENRGVFPISQATTLVDLQDVRRSSLDVTIATKFVRAGDAFVTMALHGGDFLGTVKHPYARFVSTKVAHQPKGVRITGDLTLKGITHAVTLNAVFQRRADAPTDNSELILQVTGAISRSAFGVTGFPEMVEDIIVLRFMVHLTRE